MAAEREPDRELKVEIRPMRVKDIDAILEIERLSFTTPWSRSAFLSELVENERAYYQVAWVGRQIAGYLGMWLVADEGHITNIAVHPRWRKLGVASRLLLAAAEVARERGALRLTLEVRVSNDAAQRLYRKHGFLPVGIRKSYYRDNNEDALIMWRDL